MHISDIAISAVSVLVMVLGGYLTRLNMSWYATLVQPAFTPPSWVFSIAWTIIAIAATISAIIVYRNKQPQTNRKLIFGLFIINAILNNLWTYLFFVLHEPVYALVEAGLLTVVTWALIYLLWQKYKTAALLLLPYGLWLFLALYLNYGIMLLNNFALY
jgi:tryptophan-rich sensory protein